jgi:hypothetical protein
MCDKDAPTYNRAYLPLGAGDRVRRLKQTAAARGPQTPDGGVRSFTASTLLTQNQGLNDQTVYNHYDTDFVKTGCCPT